MINSVIRAFVFAAGLAPRAVVRGLLPEQSIDSLAKAQVIITSLFRRAVTVYLSAKLALLVNSGLLTEGDAAAVTEAVCAVCGLLVVSIWSKVLVPLWVNKVMPWLNQKHAA
jgi:hypothetical protein